MALSAVYDYAASQNGNHLTIVLPDGIAPILPPRQIEAGAANVETVAPISAAPPTAQSPPTARSQAGTSLTDLVARFRADSKGLAKSTRETMDFHFKVAARRLPASMGLSVWC